MGALGEWVFAVAVDVAGLQMRGLELLAVGVALAMVACNIREIHWGWPLAAISSAMYLALFWHTHLYGSALLQGIFIVAAFWGWWQWLRPVDAPSHPVRGPLVITSLPRPRWAAFALVWGVLWLAIGTLMQQSDSPAPWWDAFVTAGSLIGQYLLGRKHLQNWTVWLVVNVFSLALYASQGLWPTALLYGVFAVLSVAGWRAWHARLPRPMPQPPA